MPSDAEEIQKLRKRVDELEKAIAYYEGDGVIKLFYGLNRKAGEMADILNATNLKFLDLADPKDKTFERLKIVWNDAASMALVVKSLGETAEITGDEDRDMGHPKYRRITSESMAEQFGDNKQTDV